MDPNALGGTNHVHRHETSLKASPHKTKGEKSGLQPSLVSKSQHYSERGVMMPQKPCSIMQINGKAWLAQSHWNQKCLSHRWSQALKNGQQHIPTAQKSHSQGTVAPWSIQRVDNGTAVHWWAHPAQRQRCHPPSMHSLGPLPRGMLQMTSTTINSYGHRMTVVTKGSNI